MGNERLSTGQTVAIVGARGHVGADLIGLLSAHPSLTLVAASSRELRGQSVAQHVSGLDSDLVYTALEPGDLAKHPADVWVMALPNGHAAPYVEAIESAAPRACIIDVSTDHRFTAGWTYGQTERFRAQLHGARRIANPGCYATGMQLGLWPVVDLLGPTPHVFGVSGYSGAGTRPSPKNDPELLRDNLLPYALVDHVHAREVSHHLGRRVFFSPHVAPFFRGIMLTISMAFDRPVTLEQLTARYRERYDPEPLIHLIHLIDEPPRVRDIAGKHHVEIGGLTVAHDGRRAVVVVTLDNLLKGAATQALQNINLACGYNERAGIMS